MSQQNLLWPEVIAGPQTADLLKTAMAFVATSLSQMVGRPIQINVPRIETIPIMKVATLVDNPETEVVGVYLLIEGEMVGQALLMLPFGAAFYLVDLLMELTPGTTSELDDLTRSALAEIGNVMLAGFLNAVSESIGRSARPSPPAVVVDMHGTLMDLLASSVAAVSDDVMFIETVFKDAGKIIEVCFWVLPDPITITALNQF